MFIRIVLFNLCVVRRDNGRPIQVYTIAAKKMMKKITQKLCPSSGAEEGRKEKEEKFRLSTKLLEVR
jgi:hypothetical protein